MRLNAQRRHVQVAARPPLALRDVLEPRSDEYEGRVAVGEGTDHARPSLRPPSSSMPATRCRGLERWRGLGGLGTAGRGRAVDVLLGMPLDGMFGRSKGELDMRGFGCRDCNYH